MPIIGNNRIIIDNTPEVPSTGSHRRHYFAIFTSLSHSTSLTSLLDHLTSYITSSTRFFTLLSLISAILLTSLTVPIIWRRDITPKELIWYTICLAISTCHSNNNAQVCIIRPSIAATCPSQNCFLRRKYRYHLIFPSGRPVVSEVSG